MAGLSMYSPSFSNVCLGAFTVIYAIPYAAGCLLGSRVEVPQDAWAFGFVKESVAVGPFTKEVLRNMGLGNGPEVNFAAHMMEKKKMGEAYISYGVESLWKRFAPVSAQKYAEQVEMLHVNNQEAEHHLQSLERTNQGLQELQESASSSLELAEQQLDDADNQIFADHQRALELQKMQARIDIKKFESKVESLRKELDQLLARHGDRVVQSLTTLKDLRDVEERFTEANRQLKTAKEKLVVIEKRIDELAVQIKEAELERRLFLTQLNAQVGNM